MSFVNRKIFHRRNIVIVKTIKSYHCLCHYPGYELLLLIILGVEAGLFIITPVFPLIKGRFTVPPLKLNFFILPFVFGIEPTVATTLVEDVISCISKL